MKKGSYEGKYCKNVSPSVAETFISRKKMVLFVYDYDQVLLLLGFFSNYLCFTTSDLETFGLNYLPKVRFSAGEDETENNLI